MTVPTFLSVSGNPITSSGTLAISLSGTALPIANGGTGSTTAASAFNALNPMTTTGDIIYESGTGVASRLAIGSSGNILTVSGGIPSWAAAGVAINTIGSIDGNGASANGASISGVDLYMQSASTTNPGLVNIGTKALAGRRLLLILLLWKKYFLFIMRLLFLEVVQPY